MPIETAPGEEAQFDFSDCSAWSQRVGLGPVLWCFGMILCWSRWRLWWFTTSVDREHTFEGDRPVLRSCRRGPAVVSHRPDGCARSVAGPTVQVAPADARVRPPSRHRDQGLPGRRRETQGQDRAAVPRPVRESFLEELVVTGVPDDIDELNRRARLWVDERVHDRRHRTTGVAPSGTLRQRARLPASSAAAAVRHRLRRGPPGASGVAVHRVGRRPLLGPTGLPGPARRGPPARSTATSSTVRCGRPARGHPPDRDRRPDRGVGPGTSGRSGSVGVGEHTNAATSTSSATPAAPTPAPVGRIELPGGDFDVAAPDLAARYDIARGPVR